MTRRTLRPLWSHYFRVSKRLAEAEMSSDERRQAERVARGLRDRLVVNYSPLVKYVAGRISGRMPGPLDQEDVVAAGLFGLLNAVETYDPGRRTKFESYAISKIRWSILDELRKLDPLSRRTRLRAHQTERTRDELVQKLGRPPTESELAGRLGISVAEHRAFLDQYARAQVRSLEARLECQGGPGAGLHDLIGDRSATDPASAAEVAEVRARLVRAIEGLGEQQRVVTTFYYYEGLTLKEIGRVLHLTEGRISQILHSALARLRQSLAEECRLSERN
ncbi:MAG: RNA polymerase sigma factor [uncultured Rubrobacteraceae bacterium]|uniref:RNA polymerase sigma factor n=1 Tax=uncultured Rubrobacteraceae bacterium TaxID=349277 RepID=A0A6J4RDF7_9ACTN|nr:MAG: RNA polymerase sigma factor [uncultured Rubrobacteraceae bacterium]